MNIVIWPKKH
ncbi:hypothetical protein FWK35_00027527 [Aphis craccivora]|uniref:Uncharacterized protein n=1 Tax=Aphis craccivora TaxID=307492 RepID=A0A6G0YZZ1_APHCR|nr:hypothetical protein FWK35_00027527 [Aphis craccivora]